MMSLNVNSSSPFVEFAIVLITCKSFNLMGCGSLQSERKVGEGETA